MAGPRVEPPSRKGFGSRLIERSLAGELGGEVSIVYDPTGMVCTISAPLPAIGRIA
jgi:two-component sensor histidine kinase